MRRKSTGMPRLTLENIRLIPDFRPQNNNWDAQAHPGKLQLKAHISQNNTHTTPIFSHDVIITLQHLIGLGRSGLV